MLSMTGFGSSETTVGKYTVTVELRSVNHRFLDVSLKMPNTLAPFEIDIRNEMKRRVARGRVTIAIQLTREQSDAPLTISEERVASGLAMLSRMADLVEEAGHSRPKVKLKDLLSLPEMTKVEQEDDDKDQIQEALMTSLDGAIIQLIEMKTVEGMETASEMSGRIDNFRRHLDKVNGLVPSMLEEAHQRLTERIAELFDKVIDPQRLAQEAAILADKANINEEVERLASHLDQYADTLEQGGQVAKRLTFLLQEMHREVNTMGSKTQNLEITNTVISMKEEVESLREQAANLE
jgi:uncharacterized protein (TIGR00255 family)